MKIFELAKELNMSSLSLVEELKSQGFKVKTHTSELTTAQIKKFHKVREAQKNQVNPAFKEIKETLVNKDDLAKRKKQAAQNKKEFPQKCQQVIKRLASYLADSGSSGDFTDYAEEQISRLVKSNPQEFSKKAQDLI